MRAGMSVPVGPAAYPSPSQGFLIKKGKGMNGFEWLMSEGGPLVCMEDVFSNTWGGIEQLTVDSDEFKNDYERACKSFSCLDFVQLKRGRALTLGEVTLDTSFWSSATRRLHIVQISACDEGVDLDPVMNDLKENAFDDPHSALMFDFQSDAIVMFDAADRRGDQDSRFLSASLQPGHYAIKTILHDPDPTCSLILHRFERLGECFDK